MCPRVYLCENVNVLAFQVKNIRTSALDLCGQASVAHYIALVDAQLCIFMPLQSEGMGRGRVRERKWYGGAASWSNKKNRDEME